MEIVRVSGAYIHTESGIIHNNFGLPLKAGDVVKGKVKNGKFRKLPVVIPCKDVFKLAKEYLKRDKKAGYIKKNYTFDSLCEDVLSYVSGMSNDPPYSTRFTIWWYIEVIVRHLLLLGYEKSDLLRMKPLNMLFFDCSAHNIPYIDENKADEINETCSFKLRANSAIYRLLYRKMQDKKYTSVPLSMLTEILGGLREIRKTHRDFFCTIEYNSLYFHKELHVEKLVVNVLLTRTIKHFDEIEIDIDDELLELWSQEQLDAIKMSLLSPVSLITGEPGAGKTTLIATLVLILRKYKIKYVIATYMGRTANRLRKLMPDEPNIYTIHMLIAHSATIDPFTFIIFDESSTIFTSLIATLFVKHRQHMQMTFVGDHNQLEPIYAGHLFKAMIKSDRFPRTHLSKVFRYTNDSIPQYLHLLLTKKELKHGNALSIYTSTQTQRYKAIQEVLEEGLDMEEEYMILTPFNNELNRLNEIAKKLYNPGESYVDPYNNSWRIGDKVMMKVNNYDAYIMNGDEGVICDIYNGVSIVVEFYNHNRAEFFFDKRKCKKRAGREEDEELGDTSLYLDHISCIMHAFACTVHKSQGSEWKRVLIVLSKFAYSFTTIELLYTALSRCKEHCVLITDRSTLRSVLEATPIAYHDNLAIRLTETDTENSTDN